MFAKDENGQITTMVTGLGHAPLIATQAALAREGDEIEAHSICVKR
jgi:hypothetical protein